MKKILSKLVIISVLFCLATIFGITASASESGSQTNNSENSPIGFYVDEDYAYSLKEIGGLYANGLKGKTIYEDDVNYKEDVIYTNLVDIPQENSKGQLKKGKIYVTVTMADAEMPVSNGKIVKDKEAAKILKATYKKKDNSIVLKTGKNPGKVLIWAINIDCNKKVVNAISLPATVENAPDKFNLYDEDGNEIKKITVDAGGAKNVKVKLVPSAKNGFALSENIEYFGLEPDCEDVDVYIKDVKVIDGEWWFEIQANFREPTMKSKKVKMVFGCEYSNKKASLSITVVDRVEKVDYYCYDDVSEEVEVTLNNGYKDIGLIIDKSSSWLMDIETNSGHFYTTDKIKLYVAKDQNSISVNDKGKVTCSKSKSVTTNLRKDMEDENWCVTIKNNKKFLEDCIVYVAFTDSSTKSTKLLPIVYIAVTENEDGNIKAMIPLNNYCQNCEELFVCKCQ